MATANPIADMLTHLRNTNQAYQESISMSSSKVRVGIAEILKTKGYISNLELTEVEGQVGKVLRITFKYGGSRECSIAGLRRVSKPGLRVYAKANAPPKVPGGFGIVITSASQGLPTDEQANARSADNEVLAYVQ